MRTPLYLTAGRTPIRAWATATGWEFSLGDSGTGNMATDTLIINRPDGTAPHTFDRNTWRVSGRTIIATLDDRNVLTVSG